MTKQLRIQGLSRGLVSYLRLYGTVDETFSPDDLMGALQGRDVILNMKAVTRFSSFGVREWVHAMGALNNRVDHLVLVDCSPAVVAQINMVTNFVGKGTVASVRAPFFCERCSWDTEVAIETNTGGVPVLPVVSCKSCKTAMVFDDEAPSYFAFTRERLRQSLSPDILSFIKDFERAVEEPESPAPASMVALHKQLERLRGLAVVTRLKAHTGRGLTLLLDMWAKLPRRVQLGVGLGVAVSAIVLFTIALQPSAPAGVPAGELARFHEQLQKGAYAEATAVLDRLAEMRVLTPALRGVYDKQIEEHKKLRGERLSQQAQSAARKKDHATTIERARAAIAAGYDDADTRFVLAEALRLQKRPSEAAEHYDRFIDAYKHDARLDDALYWRAEAALEAADWSTARELYERVVEHMPRSNYRRSAMRRLRGLGREAEDE